LHHLPAGPPLSARASTAVRRLLLRIGALLPSASRHRRRSGRRPVRRLAVGLAFTVLLTGLVLTVPVVSGAGNGPTPVVLDSSSTTSAGTGTADSPVVMGVDGLDGAAPPSPSAPASSAPSSSAAGRVVPSATDSTRSTETPAKAPADRPETTDGTTPTSPDKVLAAPGSSAKEPLPSAPGRTTPSASSARPGTPSALDAGDLGARIMALVVAARDDAGCDKSDPSRKLTDLARAHSVDMRARGYTGLVDPDGTSLLRLGAAAAAVAQGSADPSAVVSTWLAAPDGRAALLDCSVNDLGVGVADGAGGPWVTLALS
jgi:uncharacterized protein YkwD